MLNRNQLSDLTVFLLVVRLKSFRKAADQLDISASAVSHRMKALESRLGIRLLNRTSRSVAPTAAGVALAGRVSAGLDQISLGLEELQQQASGASGSIRINVLRDCIPLILNPVLPRFAEKYPNIELEVAADDQFLDVTAEGFDAGIRYAGTIPEDMVAVTLTPPLRWIAVASPGYFSRHGRPQAPADLAAHSCIRMRTGRGQLYHWEFERGDEAHEIDVPGTLVSGATELAVGAALGGVGIAYCLEEIARPHLASGRLEIALPGWASIGPPLAIYYSSRRQLPFGIQALIKTIREVQPVSP